MISANSFTRWVREEKAEASNRNGNYGSRISLIHVCLTCVYAMARAYAIS